MASIKAFRAWLYNRKYQDRIGEFISPPYDVIKEHEHKAMLEKNPLNSVALCLVDNPDDPERYRKMAARFEEWKFQQVLEPQPQPAIYLIEENFERLGQPAVRIGFVALLRTSPFEEKIVFPHERTLSGPKQDRLALLEEMRAEFSQIFMNYEDDTMILEKIHEGLKKTPPYFEFTDENGHLKKMWVVSSEADISSLVNCMENTELLIADGHHRYETALHYATLSQAEDHQWVQVYFTNTKNPQFSILPIHRLADLPDSMTKAEFETKLNEKFTVDRLSELPLQIETQAEKIQLIVSLDAGEHLLISKEKESEDDAEVFSLQKDIFEGIYGLKPDQITKGRIYFEHERQAYLNSLSASKNRIGFYLPPTDMDLILRVVHKGQRMPQKSTFFYPKLSSGLVNYQYGYF